MARKPRVHYEGALYHVICRGNNRSWIFKESGEKSKYLEIIKHYKKKYQFKLYAYCIMDNHAHLLIEVGHVPLSKIMQGIQQVYTQQYNKNHKRTGHVFEQRYKAIHCDRDQYLLGLINYIHMNPVRANIESGVDYCWSSHQWYLKGKHDGLTDIGFPLSLFGGNSIQQRQRYMAYMAIEDTEIKEMKPKDLSANIDEYEEIRKMHKKIEAQEYESAEVILGKVCNEITMSCDTLKQKSKKPDIVRAKRLASFALKELAGSSNTQISKLLNVSMTTVTTTLGNDEIKEKVKADLDRIRQTKA